MAPRVRLAGAATVVAFLVTTPALLFDLSQARHDLGAEASVTHTVADGLSRPGNARWYHGTALPATMTWAIYLLAVVGIVYVLRRRVPYQLMLVAFAVIFLIGISVSSLHWQRWSIELVPVLSLFAALAVVEIAGWISTRLGAPRAGLVVAGIATLALVVVPVLDLVDVNRVDSEASSRVLARRWVQQHVPSGSRVVQLPRVFNLHPDAAPPIGHGIRISYDLDPSRPLSWYRARGVDYVVVGRGDAYNAMLRGARHSGGSGFFGQLACTTRLVADLKGHDTVDDLGVSVYRLDRKPVRLLNFLCLQPDPGSR